MRPNGTAPVMRAPQRTCVACRKTGDKLGFVRLVRKPDGTVEVDSTGKANGRGAYLCSSSSCWDQALEKDKLARALRTPISASARTALRDAAPEVLS